MSTLCFNDLGVIDYPAASALQERLVELRQRGTATDTLLFVEHPHVYTLGRSGKEAHVLAPQDVPVYRTSRGGDVTYHGPGQLVVYPIIDLHSKLRKRVHRYLTKLELTAIKTLADYGLEGMLRPPYTGIWIEDRKIAAIGIAVHRGVTFHGLALNVNPDLTFFERIVPCGLAWADVTSMEQELGARPTMSKVREKFLHQFAEVFGYTEIKLAEDRGWNLDDGDPPSSTLDPRAPAI